MSKLASYIENNRHLRNLDLQWLQAGSLLGITPLLEVLAGNRRLRSVNLSWNILNRTASLSAEEILSQQDWAADQLVSLVKYNKKLMHLDLSNTGLTTLMFNKFVAVWNKVMSLVSCHFSGNPFVLEIEDY